jgi:hypothetical protein
MKIENGVASFTVSGHVCLIDVVDLPLIEGLKLSCSARARTTYVYSYTFIDGKQKNTYLHRLLTACQKGMDVDHINGNGLDNRRENLRVVTHAENMKNMRKPVTNTSGVKGVRLRPGPKGDRWSAEIRAHGDVFRLGRFGCKTAAAIAYAKASKRLHGEFGRID